MHSLFFDTTDRYYRLVQLKKNNQVIDEIKIITKKCNRNKQSNHFGTTQYHSGTRSDRFQTFQGDILMAIETILKRNNLKLKQIEKTKANPGPGSFTGIRVGLSIANALNYALGYVKDFKNDLQMPEYGDEPHITIKTKSK